MADQTQLYHSGSLTDGWRLFGAHPATEGDVHGWWFNVWAPHAKAVSVVGDFNGWDLTVDPLTQKGEFWQGFLPDLPVYTSYKYAITGEDGRVHYKADPYGFHTETRPGTASKLYDIEHFSWTDEDFRRNKQPVYHQPLNIYEVHLGSWRKHDNGEFLDYQAAIPQGSSTQVTVSTRELIAAVDRASLIISDRLRSPLRLKFEENSLRITCTTSLGKAYDEVPCHIEGAALEMGFNNKYVLDALRAADCDEVCLQISGPLSPMKMVPPEGDSFLFLVLPVRLKTEQ